MTLTGDNGLLNRTTIAKEKTEIAGTQEELQTAIEALKIDYYANRQTGTIGEYLAAHESDLQSAVGDKTLEVDGDKVTYKGYDFTVNDTTGKITGKQVAQAGQVWTQNGTSVSDGNGVDLTVGTQVTGYSVTGHTDLNWYVLGAKDGKLLITTNTCPEYVSLAGTAGFTNADGTGCPWVTTLNTVAANYSDGDMAKSARTIDFDDIKRIDSTPVNPRVGEVFEYGNKVTYTLKASTSNANDKVIWYRGTKQPTTETESTNTSFQYWGKNSSDQWEWITLGDGQSSSPIESTLEGYDADSLAASSAKTLLFTNTGNYPGDRGSYWLGSPHVTCGSGEVSYDLYFVGMGGVNGVVVFSSDDGTHHPNFGLRPVVSLKSSVKVTNAGVVSK